MCCRVLASFDGPLHYYWTVGTDSGSVTLLWSFYWVWIFNKIVWGGSFHTEGFPENPRSSSSSCLNLLHSSACVIFIPHPPHSPHASMSSLFVYAFLSPHPPHSSHSLYSSLCAFLNSHPPSSLHSSLSSHFWLCNAHFSSSSVCSFLNSPPSRSLHSSLSLFWLCNPHLSSSVCAFLNSPPSHSLHSSLSSLCWLCSPHPPHSSLSSLFYMCIPQFSSSLSSHLTLHSSACVILTPPHRHTLPTLFALPLP